MPSHKSEDYKITAVKFHLENDSSFVNTCKIFKCSERSLKRWIEKYKTQHKITRNNRSSISYKITQEQVKDALQLLKENEQITMNELQYQLQRKHKTLDISPQHLGTILRENNKTRKRTRHSHFPVIRYKKPIFKQTELTKFYSGISKYPINKIISIDETAIRPVMMNEYSRCELGKRCIFKTDNTFMFRKYTLLVAISNSKCIGWTMFEKGAMNKERLVEFMKEYIFRKYKDHLIVMDNAGGHRNNYVWNAITESGNQYLHSVPYTPITNPIEAFFNQVKHYLKQNKSVLRYNELNKSVENAIAKVKPENYKNYFNYAFDKEQFKLPSQQSTRRRTLKKYKK
jgi:transposase